MVVGRDGTFNRSKVADGGEVENAGRAGWVELSIHQRYSESIKLEQRCGTRGMKRRNELASVEGECNGRCLITIDDSGAVADRFGYSKCAIDEWSC